MRGSEWLAVRRRGWRQGNREPGVLFRRLRRFSQMVSEGCYTMRCGFREPVLQSICGNRRNMRTPIESFALKGGVL